MRTPVVTIETEAGPVRIDRDAYDPATDTLAEDQDEDFEPFTDTAPPAPPAPPAPAVPFEPVTPPAIAPAPPAPPVTKPVEAFVTKNGDKWSLADKDGKSVDDVEYETKKAAGDALELRNKPAA